MRLRQVSKSSRGPDSRRVARLSAGETHVAKVPDRHLDALHPGALLQREEQELAIDVAEEDLSG